MIPVSICLTTYNRAAVLPKTLDSILSQKFGDFELIINDDCSTDDTEEVCRDSEVKDSRVKYFCNSTNLRMPGNLNAAIQRATGTYIANLHDGDIYRSDLIAKWKEALDNAPDAPFVFNAYDAFQSDGSRVLYREPFQSRVPGAHIAAIYFRSLTSCVWGTVMTRSSAYAQKGLFDPTIGFISDVDMWLRLAKGREVAYVPEPLITVAPRESDHPFSYYSWDHLFWQFGIYTRHIGEYQRTYPTEFRVFPGQPTIKLRKTFLLAMLWLLKYRKWERVREGFGIWRHADDPVLKALGILFGKDEWQPRWYDRDYWAMARGVEINGTRRR
jgi:glycosyltransferase involved in cell wall biosynthesis